MERNMAGTIFAVLTLVTPSTFVPIRMTISEPVTDIYVTVAAETEERISRESRVIAP